MVEPFNGFYFDAPTSSKWAKITKASQNTAGRDINDLVSKEILIKEPGGGGSTSYVLNSI
jgi:Fic family protein